MAGLWTLLLEERDRADSLGEAVLCVTVLSVACRCLYKKCHESPAVSLTLISFSLSIDRHGCHFAIACDGHAHTCHEDDWDSQSMVQVKSGKKTDCDGWKIGSGGMGCAYRLASPCRVISDVYASSYHAKILTD